MGYPLDTEERFTLLDLDDLLAYWSGKLLSTPLRNNPIP
jgi:hypothetical protein